ncbi:MAG TPA: GNAT family N-acetyltransferase [Chloroflexota bacterium]|jgi:ribosomal protein S18 acetylase RimI-like enzyme|nr:GNAT family N-acetyltransferase [Chloroflexota bacterium]
MADPAQILAFEECSLNAWPAANTLCYDGWLLRLNDGYTRRANSVQPLYPSALDVATKIAHCEQVYTARGLDTIFKLTPAAQPADLDAHLAALGYFREAPTRVQTRQAPGDDAPGAGHCTLDAEITGRWLDAYARLSLLDPRHRPAFQRLLAGIVPEHRFAAVADQGAIVAVALVVLDRSCAGIFDVVVDPAFRRQGIGTDLLRHLLHWASKRGARRAYLQVTAANLPAQRLYANLGFRDAYTYWYRVKKAPTGCPGSAG